VQRACVSAGVYLGLGAFGQPVERVLELLRIELRAIMQQVGAPSIKHLTPAMVRRPETTWRAFSMRILWNLGIGK